MTCQLPTGLGYIRVRTRIFAVSSKSSYPLYSSTASIYLFIFLSLIKGHGFQSHLYFFEGGRRIFGEKFKIKITILCLLS